MSTATQSLLRLDIPTFEQSSGHPVKRFVRKGKKDVFENKTYLDTDRNRLQVLSLLEEARKQPCLGLAANQCRSEGIPDQIDYSGWLDVDAFILKLPGSEPIAMIAPTISEAPSLTVRTQEGCLTYPRKFVKAVRQTRIKLDYFTLDAENHSKVFEGLAAQIIQHELDHLLGHDDEVYDYPISAGERGPLSKIGRNDTCPCGSEKKYKKCCGALITSMIV